MIKSKFAQLKRQETLKFMNVNGHNLKCKKKKKKKIKKYKNI